MDPGSEGLEVRASPPERLRPLLYVIAPHGSFYTLRSRRTGTQAWQRVFALLMYFYLGSYRRLIMKRCWAIFDEAYRKRLSRIGKQRADRWYRRQLLGTTLSLLWYACRQWANLGP